MQKELSVIIAALDTYKEVEEIHACIERQTIRPQLEVIFICTTKESLSLPESFFTEYPDVRFVEGGGSILLHAARHLGVLNSTTPYVVITEDHCLPLPDCLEHMLNRLKEGWSGVGPSIRHGNKFSKIARAANYVTYGEWMGQEKSGEIKYIAGYNSAFSREVLLARGAKLQSDLIATSLMQASLRKQGHKFFFETKAVMYHWEASRWWGTKSILIPQGKAMGALRSRGWSLLKRLCYSAFIPGLFVFRYLRALRTYWRNAKSHGSGELFYLLPISLIWTFGEFVGYWTQGGRIFQTASHAERNRSPFIDADEAIRMP
jgi:hypothetical protein